MSARLKFVVLGLLISAFSPLFAGQGILVESPYARAVPPGLSNSAAFMVLINQGGVERRLVAAQSDIADKVELHTHEDDNGVMRMRQVPEILIPANGQTTLEPGGYHVMFLGLKRPVKEGDEISVNLRFANGDEIPVQLRARKMAPRKHHHHHH